MLQVDSLPAESPGNPKNTGVGSLSLLQGIFPTQESNRGLLHCRDSLPTELSGKASGLGNSEADTTQLAQDSIYLMFPFMGKEMLVP